MSVDVLSHLTNSLIIVGAFDFDLLFRQVQMYYLKLKILNTILILRNYIIRIRISSDKNARLTFGELMQSHTAKLIRNPISFSLRFSHARLRVLNLWKVMMKLHKVSCTKLIYPIRVQLTTKLE